MHKRLPCTYQLGTIVYLRVGPERDAGIIVEVKFTVDGGLIYYVNWGKGTTSQYEIEISTVKSFEESPDDGVTQTL